MTKFCPDDVKLPQLNNGGIYPNGSLFDEAPVNNRLFNNSYVI